MGRMVGVVRLTPFGVPDIGGTGHARFGVGDRRQRQRRAVPYPIRRGPPPLVANASRNRYRPNEGRDKPGEQKVGATEGRGGEPTVTRRQVLRAGVVGVMGTTLSPALLGAAAPQPAAAGPNANGDNGRRNPKVAVANIQGNVLAGFRSNYQALLFVQCSDRARARAWVGDITNDVATSEEVLAFNALWKKTTRRRRKEGSMPTATWMNIAFTAAGLAAMGVAARDMALFPRAFLDGMAARALLIGDVDANSPSRWVEPFGRNGIHGVMIVAADSPDRLEREMATQQLAMARRGVRVLFRDRKSTRLNSSHSS